MKNKFAPTIFSKIVNLSKGKCSYAWRELYLLFKISKFINGITQLLWKIKAEDSSQAITQ